MDALLIMTLVLMGIATACVGLLPTSTWMAARFETIDGIVHHPNLPTEEIFTTPDPQRADSRNGQ